MEQSTTASRAKLFTRIENFLRLERRLKKVNEELLDERMQQLCYQRTRVAAQHQHQRPCVEAKWKCHRLDCFHSGLSFSRSEWVEQRCLFDRIYQLGTTCFRYLCSCSLCSWALQAGAVGSVMLTSTFSTSKPSGSVSFAVDRKRI